MKKNYFDIGECNGIPYEVSERCNYCLENTEINNTNFGCRFCWKDQDQMACGADCGDSCTVDEDIAFEDKPAA